MNFRSLIIHSVHEKEKDKGEENKNFDMYDFEKEMFTIRKLMHLEEITQLKIKKYIKYMKYYLSMLLKHLIKIKC